MTDGIPRLRMFAGPNGSGKTTIKSSLDKSASWFGVYINPDDIEAAIGSTGKLAAGSLGLSFELDDVRAYFASSQFLASQGLSDTAKAIQLMDGELDFRAIAFNSYHASVLADFLRRQAMHAGLSFSFETVMSSEDKVDLLREAHDRGYRNYLYFVATESPVINIQRIKTRVAAGGHGVPAEKIVARYHRSLNLLKKAIPLTDRAFLFDTSEETAWYFAQITNGDNVELQSDTIPAWFQPIWDSISET